MADSLQELKRLEVEFIEQFNSYEHGYNMTPGGDHIGEETRQKKSEARKGKPMPWYDKIRAARAKRGKINVPHPEQRGHLNVRAKKYIITEPDGTEHFVHGLGAWCKEWKKDVLTHGNLIAVATGRMRQYKGYLCRYAIEQGSTTRPQGRTSQAIGDGNGEGPQSGS